MISGEKSIPLNPSNEILPLVGLTRSQLARSEHAESGSRPVVTVPTILYCTDSRDPDRPGVEWVGRKNPVVEAIQTVKLVLFDPGDWCVIAALRTERSTSYGKMIRPVGYWPQEYCT